MADRERTGREASPTAAVVDAQAVRSGGVGVAGVRGYDGAKRVDGRKRHALVDTEGRLLLATVSPASLHDSHGGIALLGMSRRPWPFLARCFADRAYAGQRVAAASPVAVTLVGKPPGQKGLRRRPNDGSSKGPSLGSAAADVSPATTKPLSVPPSPSSPSPPL
jgi:putative transposase